MIPKIKDIADFYGMNRDTISKYKKSDDTFVQRRYNALLSFYGTPEFVQKPLTEMTKEELFELHEYISDRIQNEADTLQCIADILHTTQTAQDQSS